MSKTIRVIDTGLRTGRENIAHDQAMIDAHVEGVIGDSFKFIHFKPCALVGRHQDLSQELKLDECARLGVQTVRRVTGGGAIYFDEGQLGWALICDRRTVGGDLSEITAKICTAAALGLSTLGVDAQFRPRNDIEVDGQKISGTGGFFDGNTLMFQGTVLIDLDPAAMMAVLNVPAHKLKKHELQSAAQRVTCLKILMGRVPSKDEVQKALLSGFAEHLNFEFAFSEPDTKVEEMAKEIYDEEIGTDEFVAEINEPGRIKDVLSGANAKGNLTAYVRLEGMKNDRLREVIFTGDVFVTPPRAMMDLEAHLRGQKLSNIAEEVQAFFKQADIGMVSLQPSEFSDAVMGAVG
ncbi:MAG: lipoate--protein ligase family protein [Robiginitomaculum sp.]|nr:lipoate--protein ligase family protein [Robiginitomaculum sp.]